MAHFDIEHEIIYIYNKPVFQEPCKVYLIPRTDGYQRNLDSSLCLCPQPQLGCFNTDLYGNICYEAVFSELSERYEIKAKSRVETLKKNPFDYYVNCEDLTLPIKPKQNDSMLRGCYVISAELNSPIKEWVDSLLQAAEFKTVDFLLQLTNAIHKAFSVENRLKEGTLLPDRTFSAKTGSCRDLSVLMIYVLRSLNLPTRFVSGYYEADPGKDENDLHAWVEVYIQGAGWRGYDPSNGIAVQDRHVALASSVTPGEIFPVMGKYRSDVAESEMRHKVTMIQSDNVNL